MAKNKRLYASFYFDEDVSVITAKINRDYLKNGFCHGRIILANRKRDNYEFFRRLLALLQQIELGDLDNQIRYV